MNPTVQPSPRSLKTLPTDSRLQQQDWSCRSPLTPLPSSSRHNSCEPIRNADASDPLSSTVMRRTQSAIEGSRVVKQEPLDTSISSLSCPSPSSAKRKRTLVEPTRIQPMRAVKRRDRGLTMKAEVQIVETLDFDDDKTSIPKTRTKPRKVKVEPIEELPAELSNRSEPKRFPKSTKKDLPITSPQAPKLVLRIPARPPLADTTANGTSSENAIIIKPDPDILEVDSISALKRAATKIDNQTTLQKRVRKRRRRTEADDTVVHIKTEPLEKLTIRIPASASRVTIEIPPDHTKDKRSKRADDQLYCVDDLEKQQTSPLQRSDSGFFSEAQAEDRIPPPPHRDVIDLTEMVSLIDNSPCPPIPPYCEVTRERVKAPSKLGVVDDAGVPPVTWHFRSRFGFEMDKRPTLVAVEWGNG